MKKIGIYSPSVQTYSADLYLNFKNQPTPSRSTYKMKEK